ncbi:putative glutamine synthetase protein [Dioscorea alata]|uniref:Glutamine synthetase protein n=2 Tax=Dioscorea alata TaxID=55571 RepID=A0ACB7WKU4_DIOAL|nr:putative glutamine synthetase protein [Dioscorea alata]KAH7688572.1 putative glutamine synthetase protein [Dioscorea alata]
MPSLPPPRRYAVLSAGYATEYIERVHGGFARMLARLLGDPETNERWDTYHVVDGDFSFLDEAEAFDGFVITGSISDAHADDEWILSLRDAVQELYRLKKRVLGICFGHQIIARALGGATGRAEVGWELGVKTLVVDSLKIGEIYGIEFPSRVGVIESHRDQVSAIPPQAVVLASSEKTKFEMFAIGDHILGIQSHPEFSKDVMMDIIENRLSVNSFSVEFANEAIQSFEKSKPDEEVMKYLCKTFLKGNEKAKSGAE